MAIITLLTDFGLKDPYVAEMKGVILSICPEARIVDITHEVRKFDVREGAFILAQAAKYFPDGTVHVAVVDPGVGTERRSIIIDAARSSYVGPDNGLLIMAARMEGIKAVYEIKNPKYMRKEVSKTFHGRDIFSCAAAYLARGVAPCMFGPSIDDPITPSFASPRIVGDRIHGEVIYIDGFGNVITNISSSDLERVGVKPGIEVMVDLKGRRVKLLVKETYGEAALGEPLTLIGSSGFLEVAVNQGDASKAFNLRIGDPVALSTLT